MTRMALNLDIRGGGGALHFASGHRGGMFGGHHFGGHHFGGHHGGNHHFGHLLGSLSGLFGLMGLLNTFSAASQQEEPQMAPQAHTEQRMHAEPQMTPQAHAARMMDPRHRSPMHVASKGLSPELMDVPQRTPSAAQVSIALQHVGREMAAVDDVKQSLLKQPEKFVKAFRQENPEAQFSDEDIVKLQMNTLDDQQAKLQQAAASAQTRLQDPTHRKADVGTRDLALESRVASINAGHAQREPAQTR